VVSPHARLEESHAVARLRRRLGRTPVVRRVPPERPVGIKLELTHRCNLRCGFCYTDSPRRTLERAPDLPDDDWRRIVGEAVSLGVIEAVVTGGEPLLRRKLALELIDLLAASGVCVTLNTNGWFVDDELSDRLAAVADLRVHVSIDGAAPEIHDAGRGVPGSWRRAVRAVSLLLDRGVTVQAVHVVTPENELTFADFLDQMWVLGVPSIRATPVVRVGAAADSDDWAVSRRRLRRTLAEFVERHGGDPRVQLASGTAGPLAIHDEFAPAALLVRPLGAVLIDSLHPFAFGDARKQSLEECWRGIVENWCAPEVSRWARNVRNARGLGRADIVPYRDQEVPVGDGAPTTPGEPSRRRSEGPPLKPPPGADADIAAARQDVLGLALARRYRLSPVRWSGDADGDRYVRVTRSGLVYRLNRAAGVVMDACDGGTLADAVDALARRYPGVAHERLERDALAAARHLRSRGIVVPAAAPADREESAAAESISELPEIAVG